jgi:glycosyltransferase involved in cell wall biosynthesis
VAEIDIVIPTLGREYKLAPLVENIRETTPSGTYKIIFVLDSEDKASWAVVRELTGPIEVVEESGSYPVKLNAGYRAGVSPLILATGDDIVCHDGWLEAALEAFGGPGVQVVGSRDLSPITTHGQHVNMPIVRRSYCEGFGAAWNETGTVYHEGYHHNALDAELWQLAQHRGVAKFVPDCVIEHLHPDWGTRRQDATDRKGNCMNKHADHALLEARRNRWLAG